MKINPMDIQRQTFGRRFRGLDPDEVRAYLGLVAEEVVQLQQERDLLAQEIGNLRIVVEEHRQRETILKNTLLTAQRVSEELKEAARKQADTVVKEAELQADRLLDLAQGRAREVERSILDLKMHRATLRDDMRALVDRMGVLLDLEEESTGAGDKLRFMGRPDTK